MVDEWPEMSVPANTRVTANALNDARTEFNDIGVVDRSNRIDISSEYPLSERNDIFTAGVTHVSSESAIRIRANASTESLETVEQMRYIPGYVMESGIALQIPEAPTGDQEVRWGYWDGDNGAYFGWDSTGVFVETQRNGTRQGKVYKEDWNGTTNQDIEMQLTRGVVTRQVLALYDFGHVRNQVFFRDSQTKHIEAVNIHNLAPFGSTTLTSQNNPIRVEVANPDATDFDVFVGGRQGTIRGTYNPQRRINGETVTEFSLSGTTWVPVLSIRKKADFEKHNVGFLDIKAIATDNVYFQLRSDAGSDLDGDYETPSDTNASETAIEVDTTPTASISDGYKRFGALFEGGVGASSNAGQVSGLDLDIKRQRPLTYFFRKPSGQGGTLTAMQTNWEEDW